MHRTHRLILIAVVVVLAALWLAAYLHTTPGAPFGCWPEPLPPLPHWAQVWLEIRCHA